MISQDIQFDEIHDSFRPSIVKFRCRWVDHPALTKHILSKDWKGPKFSSIEVEAVGPMSLYANEPQWDYAIIKATI